MKHLVGNWKMNGLRSDLAFCEAMKAKLPSEDDFKISVAPPVTLIRDFAEQFGGCSVGVGGQDCHWSDKGTYTGDISPVMIKDQGATFVIVGHSERRRDHHETSSQVARKAQAAVEAGLKPVICVGEYLEKRQAGSAIEFVVNQLSRSVPAIALDQQSLMVAYEPVWAIGTGRTAEREDIEEMHAALRLFLQNRMGDEGRKVPILYGGSVNADTAHILDIDNVDGVLVGGASLEADSFLAIAEAYSLLKTG